MEKNKKIRLIFNVAVVMIITALSVFYLTKSGLFTAEKLQSITWYYFLIVVVVFLFAMAVLSLVDYFIYRTITKKMPYHKCLFNTLNGNLGSSVTPFKSGHFPLMIYYQYNAGVDVEDTATGLVKCQIIYSFTSIILYTALVLGLLISGAKIQFYGQTVALWTVISLGLLFHVGAFIVVVILAFNKRFQNYTLNLVARVLYKLKKIESIAEYVNSHQDKLEIYKQQMLAIIKKAHYYVVPTLLYVVYMLTITTTQYLAFLVVSGDSFSLSQMFVFYTLSLASQYITNIIPVPGGVGTAEVLFTMIFASVIGQEILGSVLIVWRVGSYYIPVIIELIIFAINSFIIKKRKGKIVEDTVNNNDEYFN